MNIKTLLIIIGLIIVGLIFKACIKRGNGNFNNLKRPPESLKPSQYVDNDRMIIVNNVSLVDLQTVLKQLCNSYNNESYKVLPLLRQYTDSTYVITFPYDIDFETFCYVVNYLYYPIGVNYHPQITAWTTTKQSDSWMKDNLVNKKVMIFIPYEDKEYDNVYLTTSDNIGYKMGFAIGHESQLLDTPNKKFHLPDTRIDDLNNTKTMIFD